MRGSAWRLFQGRAFCNVAAGASVVAVALGLSDALLEEKLSSSVLGRLPPWLLLLPPRPPLLLAASQPTNVFAPTPDAGEAPPFDKTQKWDNNWDLRDPEFLGTAEYPKATRHIFLVRHGQYDTDAETDPDRKLTTLGKSQLQHTGRRLAEMSSGSGAPFDRIIVSTMQRALESAEIIADELKCVPLEKPGDNLLREGSPYPPDPPISGWDSDNKAKRGKRLQNFFEDGPRIEAAFRKYFKRATMEQENDSHEVIVCHANVIRYFAMRALQLPPEAWLRISLKNGSITLISISPMGRVSLRALGDAGHMPADHLTVT